MKCVYPVSVLAMTLFSGYVTKVRCEGRLLISSVGSPELVALEALPAELGCGVILKPLKPAGHTNLILETSAGSVNAVLSIIKGEPSSRALEVRLKGSTQ